MDVSGELERQSTVDSNRLYEELFSHSPDAIVVTGSNGRVIEVNAQTEYLFGYTRDELLGRPIEVLLPQRFRTKHPDHRDDYAGNPHVRPMGEGLELYGLHKDGREFPVDIMLSPLQLEEPGCVLAVVRDITQRRAMEQSLQQSEERFRLLVDGARDHAIFMLDPEGRIATWNPGAERIKGYQPSEIIGHHFSIFYSQVDIDRGKPALELEEVRRHGRYEDEGWRIRKDGSRFWANVTITALHNEKKELIGFAKVTRDLTNRKRAEDALLLELSSAVLARRDIGQMLSAIASSIRQIVPYTYASIALYDPATSKLRVHDLSAEPTLRKDRENLLSMEDSPAGWAFTNRELLLADPIESTGFPRESLAYLIDAGARSGCWIPLSSHGNVIGTLFIGGAEGAFQSVDRNTLLQIAAQIALAVDSANAFRQISELTDKLKEEKRYLEEELRTEYSFEDIVGESDSLKLVLKQVETVAPADATVLILGETGTGKELIARSLHDLSPRHGHTFVKLNCSAIPLGLLESELFGHEKGAFTGAIAQRVGRLELAHQGTLFLDEIGDLPLELQPKLLRALQEREIERLGGKKSIPVNFRLLAATHRDLARMVREGTFRSDLYYRINVFPILIPPLRQRSTDIPLLVNYFVAKHARRMNKHIETVPDHVMAALSRWHWPGNVRELENFIERAVILTPGRSLQAPLGELELDGPLTDSDSSLESKEREHILQILRETRGVIAGPHGAAAKLGLKRTTLNSKLKKLGIGREEYVR